MAIAVNATRRGTNLVNSTIVTVTLTSTPTAGATLLISLALTADGTVVNTCTDSRGNSWVSLGDSGNHGAGTRALLWGCAGQLGLQSGDVITLNLSNIFAATLVAVAVDEITGLGSVTFPDKTTTGFSTTSITAITTGSTAATAYADELVWVVIATPTTSGTTQSLTPGTSYTQQGSRVTGTNVSLYTEYQIVAATGAQTATATLNTTADHYGAVLVTLPAIQSTQRNISAADVEIAATGPNRALSFGGVEVAYSSPLGHHGVSFVGVEVAYSVPAVATARRPSPMVVG